MKVIHFDYLTLELFLKENIDFLLNSRIQKIQQPTRQEIILGLRNKGESRKFYININPKFFHICFMTEKGVQKRLIEIPKSPPMFCMLLRKYLEGARIAKVSQPQNERILEFYFETYNELTGKIYLCLAIELMGKHSNVILYNYDTNVIIGCAHNVGSDKSREREIIGGLPYAYPPKAVVKSFTGFSSILSKQKTTVNYVIDKYFSALQQEEKFKNVKSKLLAITKAKLKKNNTAVFKLEKQSTAKDKANLYRRYGDLIMSNLYNNNDFSKTIEVFDYEINSQTKIKLDETKTLKENANQYYKLYNKSKTANLKCEEMEKDLKLEQENLEQVLYSIEESKKIEELFEIEDEINPTNKNLHHSKPIAESHRRITLNNILIKNFTVYVGKNNKQNDYIVSKLARSEDIWFHVHNCAGSHVLLRVEAGQTITDEIIFECAKLAKEYSSAKNSSKVGVIYTKASNLKKPPAAALGYVIYKNEKEIIID